MAKGDFYLLGVHKRLLTQCKILDVALFLHCLQIIFSLKVARYSFSGPIPPKFEHKLRRHKQSFGKIATPVVLDKDENLL